MQSHHETPRFWIGFFALLTAGLLALPTMAADPESAAEKPHAASDTALKAANALYEGIRAEKLDNGLRVYLKPVAGSPVVTTMVAYRVGSADEDLDNTGLSHYLEHLMFKGTDKLKPGDIDRMTQINGGQNNAYTTNDYTIFHFDFAADRWDMALQIEADRMQNLRIDEKHEFQQEKGAVISELERDEDEPWDLEQKTILPLLFGPNNPYGHPVIGQQAQVRAATAAIIKAHYDKWYHPNNASLIICGGFDPDQAMARVKELFGPIPSAELPPRKPDVPIEHKEPIHKEFASKFDVPRMVMGFNTVSSNDPDLPALEFTQALLSGGKTSRFYKDLVEGAEIATSADAFHSWGRYPGWFGVQMELLPGKDRAKAEQLVLAELKELAEHPVPQAEMDRVRQLLVAGAVFDREAVHQLADNIAQGVSVNNLEWLKTLLPRIAAVTRGRCATSRKKIFGSGPSRRRLVGAEAAGGGEFVERRDPPAKTRKRRTSRLVGRDRSEGRQRPLGALATTAPRPAPPSDRRFLAQTGQARKASQWLGAVAVGKPSLADRRRRGVCRRRFAASAARQTGTRLADGGAAG